MFTQPKNKAPLDWDVSQILTFFVRHPAIYMPFLKGLGIIALICIVGYFYN